MPNNPRMSNILKGIGQPPSGAPANPRMAKILQGMNTAPEKRQIYSGNLLSDVADTLSIPSYALAGLLQGKGIAKGVKERANWVDYMREKFPESNKPFLQIGKFRLTPSNTIGTALNVILDPTWLIPPAKIGKAIGAGAKALGVTEAAAKALEGSRLAAQAEKYTIPALGVAIRPSTRAAMKTFGEITDKAVLQESRLLEPALNVAREISKLPSETQNLISQYIEAGGALKRAEAIQKAKDLLASAPESLKGLTSAAKQEFENAKRLASEAIPATRDEILAKASSLGIDPEVIRSLGDKAVEVDKTISQALADAGVLSQQTIDEWAGQHLRRVYGRYEDTMKYIEELRKTDPAAAAQLESTLKNMGALVTGTKSPSLRPKIPAGASAARKDLTEAERQALGEITQAGYRLAKGAQVGAAGASRANMLKDIAKEFGSAEFRPGYLQMPEGKLWGDLSGKWVPDYIHSQLNEWVRRPSEFEKVSRKLWSYWKFGKTVANPATHARNMMSNLLLADNAGLSPARLDIYAEALADLARNGKWIQEAKNAGTAFVDTFAGKELTDFLDTITKAPGDLWQKAAQGVSKVMKTMGDAYQFEEQWGKLAVYIFKRKQGLPPADAAKAAEEWLFNYRKVPRWIDNLRSGKLGPLTVPFITFSYKAIPAYAKAIYYNPARVARWFKYAQGVEKTATVTPERIQAEGKTLPDWMKQGWWLRLPTEDKYGRSLYLDLNYIVPFNDAFQVSGLWGPGGSPAVASFPIMDLIQDLQRNQSRFTGRPIWDDGALPEQKRQAVGKYLKDFLLPPLAGGYSFDKVKDAIMKVPDWKGRTTRLDVILANVLLGLKARPVDPNEELGFRFKEVQDQLNALRSNLRSIAADPKLSQQEKDRLWQQGIDAMNRLVQETTELGDAGKALR